MTFDLTRFYQACNPNKTRDQSKAEDSQYYLDLCEVRGAESIRDVK